MKYKIATKKRSGMIYNYVTMSTHMTSWQIKRKCKQARNQNGRIKCKQIKKYFRNKKFK